MSGSGCLAADWRDVAWNTIALIRTTDCPAQQQIQSAAAAGAAAALLAAPGDDNGITISRIDPTAPGLIPAADLMRSHATELAADVASDSGADMDLDVEAHLEQITSQNLLADAPTTTANEDAWVVGSHLDSVPAGPGINDNASGAAALLDIAIRTADQLSATPIRYAWWGAEEAGLVGSTHYVNSLTDRERQQIRGYLNVDMIASPNHIVGIGGTDAAGAAGRVVADTLRATFDQAQEPWINHGADWGSDFLPFREAGIPIGNLTTGAGETKTAEQAAMFGGVAGEPYDPNYHSARDRLEQINPSLLQRMTCGLHATITTLAAQK